MSAFGHYGLNTNRSGNGSSQERASALGMTAMGRFADWPELGRKQKVLLWKAEFVKRPSSYMHEFSYLHFYCSTWR